ncbi:cytochrome P450 2B11-like [Lemur catta]|uniref:cytochrome P450 2B11-like n=1 Tax=Lemur catta TaxID=9447 RepID=UPI001E26C93E|nr:cytochrome P450 2B11-like [Lemur catta]
MELSVLLFLAVLMGLLLLLVKGRPKARGHLPPGPHPLPFLGNILQMDRGGLLKSFLRLRPWLKRTTFPDRGGPFIRQEYTSSCAPRLEPPNKLSRGRI